MNASPRWHSLVLQPQIMPPFPLHSFLMCPGRFSSFYGGNNHFLRISHADSIDMCAKIHKSVQVQPWWWGPWGTFTLEVMFIGDVNECFLCFHSRKNFDEWIFIWLKCVLEFFKFKSKVFRPWRTLIWNITLVRVVGVAHRTPKRTPYHNNL